MKLNEMKKEKLRPNGKFLPFNRETNMFRFRHRAISFSFYRQIDHQKPDDNLFTKWKND